ncbi:MAG: excinuclease ABC subunit UvrC [Acidobacteriaceae bacterium]
MDLHEKIRTLPPRPGVYLYKNADGEVIYVGKAKNLRSRVRSYLLEASQANAKTGSLMRDAVDVDYILVDNEHEALALENNLIKQRKPRFNILLRDDKTYPYVKLTLGDRWPKVFVTRRLRRDGSVYYGPYFPGNLAYRVVDLIHRSFLLPSCKVDLSRFHARPCLQYYIGRCLGPCVENLTTQETYAEAVRDAQLFLEGRTADLNKSLQQRMAAAAANQQYELAAKYRDLLVTIDQLSEKQRIASVEDDDADVFGYHCENGMIAVNLFHLRGGKIVDRREFFWEDLPDLIIDLPEAEGHVGPRPEESVFKENESALKGHGFSRAIPLTNNGGALAPEAFDPGVPSAPAVGAMGWDPGAFFSALLKQLYIDQPYVPRTIYLPVDFSDKNTLATLLADHTHHRVEIAVPQRGEKRSLVDLAAQNAKQSYDQRFRVLAPSRKAIQEALQDALTLEDLPRTIECFDISHIQGAETVASMVVWEDGEMKKSAYRKFKIKSVEGVDDYASMREVITRRYRALVPDSEADAPNQPPSDQPTTQRVPHIWPVLPDVGMKNPDQPPLYQGTTSVVPNRPYKKEALAPAEQSAHPLPKESVLKAEESLKRGEAALKGHGFSRAINLTNKRGALAPEQRGSNRRPLPSLILIDGGIGQLHAAAEALESLGLTTQPLASIAKREEVIYLYGQEDEPVVLDRRSPVLHLIQRIRDESHRFAITYHRKRREMRDRDSELLAIPGVGARTRQRLLEHFGSLRSIAAANLDSLAAVVPPKTAEQIHNRFHSTDAPPQPLPSLP